MIEIITIVVLFIIGKFFYDWNKLNKKIAHEGGMRVKYELLTRLLMEGSPSASVITEDAHSIKVGIVRPNAFATFEIIEAFEDVTVEFSSYSDLMGRHNKKWEFRKGIPQEDMFAVINNDMGH